MRGLRFMGDRRIVLHQYPDPKPGPGEVLVKISRAAVCGTDVHLYREPASKIACLDDGSPIIFGHEPAGWIAAAGKGVEGLQRGDRVLLAGVMGCGACEHCRQGYNTACEGGISGLGWKRHGADAEYLVVPAGNAFILPPEMTMETACVLTCAGGTAYTTVRETGLAEKDRLAIIGLGPVGLCLLILAKSLGVKVAGVDVNPARLEQAKSLGLDLAVDAVKTDAVAAVMSWTGGLGCDVVGECVGRPETQLQALELGRLRGRVAMAGLGNEPVSLTVQDRFIGRQLTVMGIAATPIKYFPELIKRASEFRLPFDQLVTHHFPLEKAGEAFALMESGRSGKVLFDIAEEV